MKDENGELRSLAVERAEGKLNDEASPVPKMVIERESGTRSKNGQDRYMKTEKSG